MKEDKNKELIQIRGSGGGKGGSANSTFNADDTMFSRQSASFVDVLSEGPIKGLVYGDSSVFFDDTRMRDINLATGEISKDTNFQNFTFITRDGSATQTINADLFDEFPTSSVVEAKAGAALQYNEPQYFTLSTSSFEKTNADYIKINIYTNGMSLVILEEDPTSDVGFSYSNMEKGDVRGLQVDFDIEFRYVLADGSIKEVNLFSGAGGGPQVGYHAAGTGFSGKCSSKYVQSYGMNIEDIKNSDGFTDWAIKVTRKTPHETNASVRRIDDIFVESIEVSIADKLEYPYTAYVAGVFDAENFSAIPKRAYEIDGRIIDVPTNYSPCDYNGRKLLVADETSFVVGESISHAKATLSSLYVKGNADDGYVATATTAAAHGLTVDKSFLITITGATGANASYFNVTDAIATATSTTNFTYVLATGTEALSGVTDDTSTQVPGTIVSQYAAGAVIDKIDATNNYIYLRDVGGQYSLAEGATITGGTSGATTTITSQELAFIPANYRRSPSTEKITTQDQDWDGEFYSSWSNNPAWVFKDMLNNKVYGLGNYVTASEINKWELFSIGKYCDELVPAGIKAADFLSIYTTNDTNYIPSGGSGEYEPRFTSNLVLRTKAEAFKVINDMVTVFRGIIYWLNGELYVVQDSEKDPIYQFTNANVIGGEFTYEGSAFKTRTNQVIVKWNNPQDMYRQREEYVESEEILQQDTEFLKPATMVAFGCTSRGQARRLGKWKLLSEKLNTNTVSFKTALNATFLQPGDIIRIVDRRKQGVSWGGRISSGTDTDTFVLDREFAIESGYTAADYEVMVSYSTAKALLAQDAAEIDIGGTDTNFVRGDIITQTGDGSTAITTIELSQKVHDTDNNLVAIQWAPSYHTEKRTLSSLSTTGGKTTINVASAYTATPVAEEIWLIQRSSLSTGKEELKSQLYRVITISEAESNTFEIGALEYNASKFDAVDKNEVIEEYRTYNLPNSLDAVPAVTNLSFEVGTRLISDGVNVNTISTFWEAPQVGGKPYSFVQNYLVEYSTDNNLFLTAGYTQGTSFELTDVPSGQYYFRVYTINTTGKKSAAATLDTGVVTFQRTTPQDDDGIGSQPFTINTTGTLPDSNVSLNSTTGLVSFSPTTFDYRAFGIQTSVSSQGNLDFSGLADGTTGYIYFDKSASAFLAMRWDSTGDSFYQVGANAFATATGTIQHTGGSTTRIITGSSTDFDGQLGIYNKLKVTANSVNYYPRVLKFSTTNPNTILTLNEPFSVDIPANTAFSKPTFIADYNADSIFGEVTRTNSTTYSIKLHGTIKGEDSYSINGSNENHSFAATSSGTISSFSGFSCSYTVSKGTATYSYAASGTAANTFGLSKSDSGCATVISSAGVITCTALSGSTGSTTITITDRASGATIATRIITFTKATAGVDGSGSNAKTVKLTPNYHVLNYDKDDTEDVDITFTTAIQNTSGQVYYEFLVDGSTPAGGVQNGTTTTFALHQNDEPAIGTSTAVTVKIRETSTSAAVIATDTVTIYAVQDGSDAVIAFLTNQAHVVSAAANGDLASGALDDAGGTYKVFVGGVNKTTGNSVVYSKVSNTGCTAAINSSTGVYTISAVASDEATAVFQAVVPAAATGSIAVTHTADYSISKSKVGATGSTGVRDGGVWEYEESNTSGLSDADVTAWIDSLTDAVANEVGALVIASAADNTIRPNDRITLTDVSAGKRGTRVYTASATGTAADADAADFSSIVVEKFDGSVIVDGTLSAGTLAANTTTTNTLNVGSSIITNTSGKIHSTGKTAFDNSTAGFFLGGTGHKFGIGSSSNYMTWNGSALTIKGVITADSGTFNGTVNASTGTIGNWTLGTALYNGRSALTTGAGMYLGTDGIAIGSTAAIPEFKVTAAGALNASNILLTSTSGQALSSGSGATRVAINASGGTIFSAGEETSAGYTPLKVSNDGTGVIQGFDIITTGGTKLFDKTDGFTEAALSGIAQDTGTTVTTVSKTTTNVADSDAQKITLDTQQNLTIKIKKSADMIGFATTTGAHGSVVDNAEADIPAQVIIKIQHSTSPDYSAGVTTLATATFNKYDGGTQTADEYRLTTWSESEPGFTFAESSILRSQYSNSTPITAEGNFEKSYTYSNAATGDHYFWGVVGGTAGERTVGANSVSNTAASRTIEITGSGFTIDSDGEGSESGSGDITAVVAGTGLSGGATSGSATLNLDFSELTDMTGDISGTTEFIIQNSATESRKAASEIKLSNFNNDSSWTGTQTSVSGNAGTATALATGRTIGMTGDVVWTSPSFDGSGNVTAAATIQTDAVDIAMLSATGTASSSTYLRGDNTWATVSSGGGGTVTGTGTDDYYARWTSSSALEGRTAAQVLSDIGAAASSHSHSYDNYQQWQFDTTSNTSNETVTSNDVVRFAAGTGMTVNHSGDTITFTNTVTDTDTTYSEATGSAAGLMSIAHHDKLDGIETGATADQTSVSGNAGTATALATARTIGGVSFNGSANINLPGVNTAGNQNTTGSAATLTTARTIGGVSFNGSANINLPGVNAAGNQNTSGTAAGLSGTPNIAVGTLTATGNITAYYSSDINLKDNIRPIEGALFKVQQIKGVTFDWNNKATKLQQDKGHDVGLIAQEVEKVLPEIVQTRDDGIKAIQYEKMVALLVESIKELKEEVDKLKEK